MRQRFPGCWPCGLLLALFLCAAALVSLAQAQSPPPAQNPPAAAASADDGLDVIKALLEKAQQDARHGNDSNEALSALREQLAPLRDSLRKKIDALTPRLAELDNRLKQLGDPPTIGAPPEAPALAAERAELTQTRADVDAAIRRARLLLAQSDDLSVSIDERRRVLFSHPLLRRTSGILTVDFWRDMASAGAKELADFGALIKVWGSDAVRQGSFLGAGIALIMLGILAAASAAVLRWWRQRFQELSEWSRFGRAAAALLVLLREALAAPIVFFIALKVMEANGLVPNSFDQLGENLALAVLVASFGRAAAIAAFAPREPARRIIELSDGQAQLFASRLTWSARILGVAIVLNHLHKMLAAPLPAALATSALVAVVFAVIAVDVLWHSRPEPTDGLESGRGYVGARFLVWIFIGAVVAALVTGYIGFAAFVASRAVVAAGMFAAYMVGSAFIDALFSEVLTAHTERGRRLALTLGMSPRGAEIAGAILAAAAKIVLVLAALIPILGPWGVLAVDYFGAVQDALFAIRIGDITISFSAIAWAIVILALGFLAIRGIQRWLDRKFLPRTGLEPGLQNSISALLGYAGFITVAVFALAELGIDLQKIALIAGALSVGIGFGLQSVVSNFVCGIILLAERPIRVGDWVVVKSEEGFVRRISVRATEIETFDRASVLVPNSELITGVVKNWTHTNTLGRIIIKVAVGYQCDPDKILGILSAAADAHPQVEHSPAPQVLFSAITPSALEFELRCIVPNVAQSLVVKSDLHFDIFKRFRDAGIAFFTTPQYEVLLRNQGAVVPSATATPQKGA